MPAPPPPRTCYEFPIDNSTGVGCTGKGLVVFGSQLACCEYLVSQNAIDASSGKTGSGLCSRAYFDPSFTQVGARCMNHPGGWQVHESPR